MVRKACGLLVAIAILTVPAAQCRGQDCPLSSTGPSPVPPVPSYPSDGGTRAPACAIGDSYPPTQPSPPRWEGAVAPLQPFLAKEEGAAEKGEGFAEGAPVEDRNGSLLRGDPLLDRPEYPAPGWFSALEADIVKPHLKYALSAPVTLAGVTTSVSLPFASLDWTGATRLELGYRFAQGFGEFLVAYHSMGSEGSDVLPAFDALEPALLRSRLVLDVLDLDYSNREFALGPDWDMKWRAGLRLADLFAESRAEGLLLEERTSNHYWGIGPHLGLALSRRLGESRLSAFGRVEGSALLGHIRQRFEESIVAGNGVPITRGLTTMGQTQAVPALNLETGLSWGPCRCSHVRLSGGYALEEWWYVGQAGPSRAELGAQGVFLRAEWDY